MAHAKLQSLRHFTSLPVIDVGDLLDPSKDEAARRRVGQALDAACRDVGFFYVCNHGIPSETLSGVLKLARAWFALPDAVKRQISLSPATRYRGFQPLGANVTRFDGGFQRDWHEGIDLYREGLVGSAAETPVHGNNPWPVQLPDFERLLRSYIEACLQLGQALMRGIALGLGLQEDFFEQAENGGTTADTSYWVTRVLHYPPLLQGDAHQQDLADSAAKGEATPRSVQLSCGEHTDYGLLTLVNQEAGITALQVKNGAGQWINAPPIPGTLVCNLGDMLRVYTNGRYTPTAHRVVNADPSRSRVSLPFFYETAFSAVCRPIPALLAGGEKAPRCEPVIYGDYLLFKVLQNFELEQARPAEAAVPAA